jgi:hypothetical protein
MLNPAAFFCGIVIAIEMRGWVSMITFDRAKASVGLSNFVEFYEDYRKYYEQQSSSLKGDKKRLAQKLLDSNPKATSITGQYTLLNHKAVNSELSFPLA